MRSSGNKVKDKINNSWPGKMLTSVKRNKHWSGIGAGITLGAIFVISGLGKLPGQTEAYMILLYLPDTALLPILSDLIDTWVPRMELVLGVLLIAGITASTPALIAGLTLLILWVPAFYLAGATFL